MTQQDHAALDAVVSDDGEHITIQKTVWHKLIRPLAARGMAEVRAASGKKAKPKPRRAPARAAAPPPAPPRPSKIRAADGRLSYGDEGHPVRLSPTGQPQLLVASGWMDVTAFEAAGIDEGELAFALWAARTYPQSTAGRALASEDAGRMDLAAQGGASTIVGPGY